MHEVLLRVRVTAATERDRFRFTLNGQVLMEQAVGGGMAVPCAAVKVRRINEMYRMSQPRYRPPGGYWFIFELGGPVRPPRPRGGAFERAWPTARAAARSCRSAGRRKAATC